MDERAKEVFRRTREAYSLLWEVVKSNSEWDEIVVHHPNTAEDVEKALNELTKVMHFIGDGAIGVEEE